MNAASTTNPFAPRQQWWSPFARMEELSFKRTTEGWVFQAPRPFLIGRRRCYVVNDFQKAVIAGHLRQMFMMTMLAIIAVAIVAVPAMRAFESHPLLVLVGCVLVGAVAGTLVATFTKLRLRPILAGLPSTSHRITSVDQMRQQAMIWSRARIIVFALISLVLLALQLLSAMTLGRGWTLMNIIGTAMFAPLTLYWIMIYIAKIRAERMSG